MEAGVKGLMGLAEGYMSGDEEPAATSSASASASSSADLAEHTGLDLPTFPGALVNREGTDSSPESHAALPVTITPRASNAGTSAGAGTSTHSSSSSKPSLPPQASLVQTFDVPSGWIHLQSTYLDKAGGQRKIRSFGLRNLVHRAVDVEVESDLSGMLLLWLGDDDRGECGARYPRTDPADVATQPRPAHPRLPPALATPGPTRSRSPSPLSPPPPSSSRLHPRPTPRHPRLSPPPFRTAGSPRASSQCCPPPNHLTYPRSAPLRYPRTTRCHRTLFPPASASDRPRAGRNRSTGHSQFTAPSPSARRPTRPTLSVPPHPSPSHSPSSLPCAGPCSPPRSSTRCQVL